MSLKNRADERMRIIVADDEEPLRAKLRMFDWERLGAAVIGEAEDGEEALDLCFKLHPDIVLVDITMPVMNGMELLAVLKEKLPHIQVILLTCHNQFEYAQTAIKLGATDYLLKMTLTPLELQRSLLKARSAIASHATLKEHLDNEQRQRRAQQFRTMLTLGDEQVEPMLGELLDNGVDADKPRFPLRYARLTLYSSRDDEILIDYELQKELSALQQQQPELVWLPLHTGDYFIYAGRLGECERKLGPASDLELELGLTLERRLAQWMHTCREAIQRRLHFIGDDYYLFAAATDAITSGAQFKAAFRESFQWTNYVFYFRDQPIVSGSPPLFHRAGRETEEQLNELALERSKSKDELLHVLREDFIGWSRKHMLYPEDLKQVVSSFLLDWAVQKGQQHADFETAITSICRQAATLDELVMSIIRVISEQPHVSMRNEVVTAKHIIYKQMHEPLTLSHIADEVDLSPDYLGKLFYEQTGENFKQYLTKVRMQKAMDLLRTTNLKVYTIAEQVGIPNYSYFSVLFRKWAGISPTQMKRGGPS